MKKLFYILPLLLSGTLLAQNNYVATSPASPTPGVQNTLVGINAGNSTMSGRGDNVFIGYKAGTANTTGFSNAFMGSYAGSSNTTGFSNTFAGYYAGNSNTEGAYNSFFGTGAGNFNTLGFSNTFIGHTAGINNTSGFSNVFVGHQAGSSNIMGNNNTFIGELAGRFNRAGYSNAYIGTQAGYNNQTGRNNVAIGDSAGYNNTVSNNIFVGSKSGFSNTTGSFNVITGAYAGYDNTTGSFNVITGLDAGRVNTTGSFNTFMGHQAGSTNTTGTNNTFLGFRADAGSANLSNATAIGNNAKVNISNALILGNGANVGIGNSAPTNRLHITAPIANTSGLRLENLTSSTPASVTNQTKFLTVNAIGDVILGSINNSSREGVSESLWQRSGKFVQNTQGEAIIIGQNVGKTPAGYKLFVEEGILTEKVKVAVKNTSDWSDKVFQAGYKLRSLGQIEEHIKQTGHLPGIPSAAEVVEKGIDLGKMDAKLLEKIEEITLHMIDMHKQVNALQKENQSLRQELKNIVSKKGN